MNRSKIFLVLFAILNVTQSVNFRKSFLHNFIGKYESKNIFENLAKRRSEIQEGMTRNETVVNPDFIKNGTLEETYEENVITSLNNLSLIDLDDSLSCTKTHNGDKYSTYEVITHCVANCQKVGRPVKHFVNFTECKDHCRDRQSHEFNFDDPNDPLRIQLQNLLKVYERAEHVQKLIYKDLNSPQINYSRDEPLKLGKRDVTRHKLKKKKQYKLKKSLSKLKLNKNTSKVSINKNLVNRIKRTAAYRSRLDEKFREENYRRAQEALLDTLLAHRKVHEMEHRIRIRAGYFRLDEEGKRLFDLQNCRNVETVCETKPKLEKFEFEEDQICEEEEICSEPQKKFTCHNDEKRPKIVIKKIKEIKHNFFGFDVSAESLQEISQAGEDPLLLLSKENGAFGFE